jgi:hypothetical protein
MLCAVLPSVIFVARVGIPLNGILPFALQPILGVFY